MSTEQQKIEIGLKEILTETEQEQQQLREALLVLKALPHLKNLLVIPIWEADIRYGAEASKHLQICFWKQQDADARTLRVVINKLMAIVGQIINMVLINVRKKDETLPKNG